AQYRPVLLANRIIKVTKIKDKQINSKHYYHLLFILLCKMSPNPVKTNRSIVNLLWQQNIRTPKEISSKTGIPLRTCQRYVSLLKKSGKLCKIHKSGRPRKLTSEKRRQLGMIIKSNHYTTTTKMKTILEEKYQTFDVVIELSVVSFLILVIS